MQPLLLDADYPGARNQAGHHGAENEQVQEHGRNEGVASGAGLSRLWPCQGSQEYVGDKVRRLAVTTPTPPAVPVPPVGCQGPGGWKLALQGCFGSLAAVKSKVVGPWSLWGEAACQISTETTS